MNLLRTLLIGGDDNLEKRNMVWNMLGSLLYAFASMVLSIVVIQVVGEDEGGIFSFAFSALDSICLWSPISECVPFILRI